MVSSPQRITAPKKYLLQAADCLRCIDLKGKARPAEARRASDRSGTLALFSFGAGEAAETAKKLHPGPRRQRPFLPFVPTRRNVFSGTIREQQAKSTKDE
jgi:hypothetical protein